MKSNFTPAFFTRNRLSKCLSATVAMSVLLSTTSLCHADFLDRHADEFFGTTTKAGSQTGSYLATIYKDKIYQGKHQAQIKPSDAVKLAIEDNVTRHRKYIETEFNNKGIMVFDYANKKLEVDNIYKKLKSLFLKEEIIHKDTHSFFYHGHSGPMSLYYDIVNEVAELGGIKNLKGANPLHNKSPELNKVKNVQDFLKNGRYEKAHQENVKKLKALAQQDPQNYGIYKNLVPYDKRKNLGVGKAPDSSDYSRDHMKCVNFNPFGNRGEPGCWAESTFVFWLTSSNIAPMGKVLMEKYFKQLGYISQTATQPEVDATLAPYESLYNSLMAQAGGGMIQIRMKNEIVDEYGFASWAKGIPYYMERKNNKFALRGNNNKAIPELGGNNKDLKMPSLRKMIDLYKRDPELFCKKFSYDGKMGTVPLDRVQARLFINPKVFADGDLVKLKRISRNSIDPTIVKDYKVKLRQQVKANMMDAMVKKQVTKDFYTNNYSFKKLADFIFKDKPTDKTKGIFNIVDIATHKSKGKFLEFSAMMKEVAQKGVNVSANALKKIQALELIHTTKEALKKAGKFSMNFLKHKIASII